MLRKTAVLTDLNVLVLSFLRQGFQLIKPHPWSYFVIEKGTQGAAIDILESLNALLCDDATELSAVVSGGDQNGGKVAKFKWHRERRFMANNAKSRGRTNKTWIELFQFISFAPGEHASHIRRQWWLWQCRPLLIQTWCYQWILSD